MKQLQAICIDDEMTALDGLRQKIEKLFPDIQILAVFQKPEEALDALKNISPDIVFLDVEMPRMTGFELLSQLPEVSFQVIFVTAYSEYALQALKQSAVDYVLKPIDDSELTEAITKARRVIEEKRESDVTGKLMDLLEETITRSNKIIVPTTKGLSFIPQDEVVHLEGYDGYTRIHLIRKGEVISSYNLGKFEKMLGPSFFKCHKSHIVNLEKVRAFENEGYLVLENGKRIPISRTHKKAFLSLFNPES